jgi:hypothetical protein
VFQKLPEWAQRADLIGWVRGDEATNPEVMNELARLSRENGELRAQAGSQAETFAGLTFEELRQLLAETRIDAVDAWNVLSVSGVNPNDHQVHNLLDLYEALGAKIQIGVLYYDETTDERAAAIFSELTAYGLLKRDFNMIVSTEIDRRFRNRLLVGKRLSKVQPEAGSPPSIP